jgi:hypothetical protein
MDIHYKSLARAMMADGARGGACVLVLITHRPWTYVLVVVVG